ncbi:MAG: hypothetical protein RIM23_24100 [Coleofasciculus sp. G3-WIS-01]|uniref:hypothetical protein n=1 Tax=Coleofasciculus sp. G3-WIS-01 TaxID=3069528 RepID=UPI0032F55755
MILLLYLNHWTLDYDKLTQLQPEAEKDEKLLSKRIRLYRKLANDFDQIMELAQPKTFRSPESRAGGCLGKLADCLFIETHVAQKTETGK